MRIIDCSADSHLDCTVTRAARDQALPVAAEHGLEVFVNERPAMKITCTPQHLAEMVLGRLLTEGFIRRPEEIEEIYICEKGLRAKVLLCAQAAAALTARKTETVGTCCTDNRTLLAGEERGLAPVTPIVWQEGWIRGAAAYLQAHQPLYADTHALHACCLAREGHPLCCREDLGRHNALDKAVGWALETGEDLSRCLLYTTGRMPADMVSKAIRAGVPLLASKTYPTDQGIALARQAGLTLVTLRRDGGLLVWNDGNMTERNENND